MGNFGVNLKNARIAKNMKQEELATRIGLKSGNIISTWETGTARPDSDKIVRLCEVLGISADALLGVSANEPTPTVSELTGIQKYRALDEHGKTVVEYLLNQEYERTLASAERPRKKPRLLKLDWYRVPVSAGTGTFLETDTPETILVKDTPEAEEADYVLSVSGDSMEPEFHDGDKVLVCKQDTIEIDEIGIFVINGDAFIKQLGKNKLISLNAKYKPIPLGENDSVYCCGRVVGIVEE